MLDTGHAFPIAHDAQGLEEARSAQLADIEISPSGLGLHFPQLDADLYLPALLHGLLGSRQWMAQAMGKVDGKAVSTKRPFVNGNFSVEFDLYRTAKD